MIGHIIEMEMDYINTSRPTKKMISSPTVLTMSVMAHEKHNMNIYTHGMYQAANFVLKKASKSGHSFQ
ncbi:hypothetical protein KY285_004235 [Solanum tuberosum]|nr:hypothetical protein KY284_003293 [Solanum tuberosum]KAH0768364.1 hypothetical protein KY285_004235 [Solanum tuberosum]